MRCGEDNDLSRHASSSLYSNPERFLFAICTRWASGRSVILGRPALDCLRACVVEGSRCFCIEGQNIVPTSGVCSCPDVKQAMAAIKTAAAFCQGDTGKLRLTADLTDANPWGFGCAWSKRPSWVRLRDGRQPDCGAAVRRAPARVIDCLDGLFGRPSV